MIKYNVSFFLLLFYNSIHKKYRIYQYDEVIYKKY